MEKSRETIDASVRDYAAGKRQSLDAHPEAEELAAYHRGELAGAARETIRDHLALCEECTRLVLDLASFAELEPPSEDYRLSKDDVEEQKEALLTRIQEEEEPSARILTFSPRDKPTQVRVVTRIPWWYHAAAAALLVATIGLAYREIPGLAVADAPQGSINLEPRNLVPIDSGLRGTLDGETIRLAGEESVFLLLDVLDPGSYASYRVEIFDAAGERLWRRDGFQKTQNGNFTFILPRQLRRAGTYTIRLHGRAGESLTLVAEYLFTLQLE